MSKPTLYVDRVTRRALGTICFRCGCSEDLRVHHVDHDRYNNTFGNLRLLCRVCHHTTHLMEEAGLWDVGRVGFYAPPFKATLLPALRPRLRSRPR